MSPLHLVVHPDALTSCLEIARSGDAVLLLEDGVYAAATGNVDFAPVYAVRLDLAIRGLAGSPLGEVTAIDYAGFVELCTKHQPIVTWT